MPAGALEIPSELQPLQQLLVQAMLPAPLDLALVQACSAGPERIEQACERWMRLVDDPIAQLRRDTTGVKRHLPRLYARLAAAGVRVGREFEPYLRTAVAREQMRSRRYRRALADALGAFSAAGLDVTLLRGAALGEAILAAPWMRHSHDADLHVGAQELECCAAALRSAGFRAVRDADLREGARFDHDNGLPICLHTRLLDSTRFALPEPSMLARRIAIEASGIRVACLTVPDMFVHTCCHAALSARRGAHGWVLDALDLVSAPAFDWSVAAAILQQREAWLLGPALATIEAIAPGTVPATLLQSLPARSDPEAREDRRALIDAAARSLGPVRMLGITRAEQRREVLGWLAAGVPQALLRGWNHHRFVHWRRSRPLGPLRRLYLALKPRVVSRGARRAARPDPGADRNGGAS